MKKFYYLLVCVVICFITACSHHKDVGNGFQNSSKINQSENEEIIISKIVQMNEDDNG